MSERDWDEIERLRQQVLSLENAGMETAAKLGEAEAERDRYRKALEQIANGTCRLQEAPKLAREALDA